MHGVGTSFVMAWAKAVIMDFNRKYLFKIKDFDANIN